MTEINIDSTWAKELENGKTRLAVTNADGETVVADLNETQVKMFRRMLDDR